MLDKSLIFDSEEEGWLALKLAAGSTGRRITGVMSELVEYGMRSMADLEYARLKSRSHVSGLRGSS